MDRFSDLRRHGSNRRRLGGRIALGAAVSAVVLFLIPATAVAAAPAPAAFTIDGTVTWLGGPDSRAVLNVGACLLGETGPGGDFCPSLRTAPVAPDGSYSLALPYGRPSTWNLFAIVTVGQYPQGAPTSFAMGAVQEISVPQAPLEPVPLTISTRAVALRIVDFEGEAFPEGTASVLAGPTSTRWWSVATADAEGDVLLFVDPAVEYGVNAFAVNTGWPDPWVAPDGTEFHFSEQFVTALGADIPEGMTFVVQNPAGTLLRVVDGQGSPFPAGTAGVQACGGSGYPECDPYVASLDVNGDGYVLLELDATTSYEVNGFALNTGWPDPWVAGDGTEFHFATAVVLLGADVEEGTVFVVSEPSGTLLRVVDAQGDPFPAGTAGVQACDVDGIHDPVCVSASDGDGDGNVLLELDATTRYEVNAFATNTGWPDPWVAPDGTEFHFSTSVTLLGADVEDGTTFVITNPAG